MGARLEGLLLKQATNFFAEWQLRAFQVCKGRIRYWADWDCKTAGYRPKYEYSLLNAQVDLIRTSDSRFQLTLKGSKAVDRLRTFLWPTSVLLQDPMKPSMRIPERIGYWPLCNTQYM